MIDKKDDKASLKKTMKQLLEEKAQRQQPHYLSLKNKAKAHKGSNKAPRPII
ncbi:MAG: hypothetical protein V7761_05090 [Amylibacter sp.]